jgi:CHASE3 domain sensor protein
MQSATNNISDIVKRLAEITQTPEYIKTMRSATNNVSDIIKRLAEITQTPEYIKTMQFTTNNIYIWVKQFMQAAQTIEYPNLSNFEDLTNDDFDTITVEENQVLAEAIVEIIDNPLNIQQNIVKWFAEFKDKNPLINKLFIFLLNTIHLIFVAAAGAVIAVVILNANVREEPAQSSPIVANVTVNQSVTIINEVPYYYEIDFIDEDTEEEKSGFVSKRSIKKCDCNNTIENVDEDNNLEYDIDNDITN